MAVTREELYPERGGVVIDFPARPAGSRPSPLPRVAGGRAQRRGPLRVTTRGRALLAGLALALAVVCLLVAVGAEPEVLSRPGAPKAVVVGPGETLWDLARRHAGPGVDTRAYVDAVIALNEVEGAPGAAELVRLPPGADRQDRDQKVSGSP